MKKMSSVYCAIGLGLALQANGLGVSPMLVYFHAGNNVQDITVENADQVVEYASITPLYLQNMGLSTVKAVPFNGTNPQAFGLMITPTKMALQPQASRKIRLVNLMTNVQEDRVYTLTVTNINPTEKVEALSHGSSAQMSLTYGYKIRVFVLPINPLPIIHAKRNGTSVTITNTGNSYISLRSGQLCDLSGGNCKPLTNGLDYHALYVGNSWTFNLPRDGVVKYSGVYAETKNMAVQSN
ncbi:MAG: fimbria/pilus periplasmic chaperone [Gammaproteobacteria bacterium]|nr:fimbria/pilus periplasmic chaperone [Gammaproteobacteria bacterium]